MEKRKEISLNRKTNTFLVILLVILSLNVMYKTFEIYVPHTIKQSTFDVVNDIGNYLSEQIFVRAVPLLSYTFSNQEALTKREQLKGYETSYFNAFFAQAFPLMDFVLKQESLEYETVAELYPEIKLAEQDKGAITVEGIEEDEDFSYHTIEAQHPESYVYTLNELKSLDFLSRNIYTIDSTVQLTMDDFPIEDMLSSNMQIDMNSEAPKVLIYHTHSQEAFIDSRPGEPEDTVVGLGKELKRLLEETYGINVIHDEGVYDLINGQLDRSKAYSLATGPVTKHLEEYPSIEVIIDIHRDGVPDNVHLVTEIEGRPTAKIMFFNGISKRLVNGVMEPVKGFENPYVEENLAFSLQLQLKAAELYPGFTRKIYIKGYRYNMHLMPKALLVEVGAQNNTVEEAKNAMIPLAKTLYEVIK